MATDETPAVDSLFEALVSSGSLSALLIRPTSSLGLAQLLSASCIRPSLAVRCAASAVISAPPFLGSSLAFMMVYVWARRNDDVRTRGLPHSLWPPLHSQPPPPLPPAASAPLGYPSLQTLFRACILILILALVLVLLLEVGILHLSEGRSRDST